MGARIDQFCEDLRQKLTIADSGLDGLKEKINCNTAHVEQDDQEVGDCPIQETQRLLLHGDFAVPLGSRALDILIALVGRSGELLSKNELMGRVWPNTFVEPANLTVHVAALRRVLGDGRDGARYIVNIPGRDTNSSRRLRWGRSRGCHRLGKLPRGQTQA